MRCSSGLLAATVVFTAGFTSADRTAPITRSYGETDGLIADHVTSLAQDAAGTLWVGTAGGLFRLAGIRFDPDPDSPNPIAVREDPRVAGSATAAVPALLATADGALWAGTDEGLFRRDPAGAWSEMLGVAAGLESSPILAIVERRDGEIWAGGPLGLGFWDGSEWHRIDTTEEVSALAEDPAGRLWVGTSSGILILNGKSVVERIPTADYPGDVTALQVGPAGDMWAGTNGGLVRFADTAVAAVLTEEDGIGDNGTTALLACEDSLWIGTGFGLTQLAAEGISARLTNSEGLVDNRVTTLARDSEGSLWVGTRTGLSMVPVGSWRYETAPEFASSPIAAILVDPAGTYVASDADLLGRGGSGEWLEIANGDYAAIAVQRDVVWVGGESGLAYLGDGPLPAAHPEITVPVRALLAGPDGVLWVGTVRGIAAIHSDGSIQRYDKANSALTVDEVLAIWTDSDDAVWVGSSNGGAVRIAGGEPQRIDRQLSDGSLADDIVTDGLVDGLGAMWFATDEGVSRLAPGASAADPASWELFLPGAKVNALVEDPRRPGHIWSGSRSGLHLLAAGGFTGSFTTLDGLPHNTVQSLAFDGETLWIGTASGLAYHDDAGVPPQVAVTSITVDGNVCVEECDRAFPYQSQTATVDLVATDLADPTGATYRIDIAPPPPAQNPPTGVLTHLGRVTFELKPGTTYEISVEAADRHLNTTTSGAMTTLAVAAPSLIDRARDSRLTLPLLIGAVVLLGAWLAWRAFGVKLRRIRYRDAVVNLSQSGEGVLSVTLQLQNRHRRRHPRALPTVSANRTEQPTQARYDLAALAAHEEALRRSTVASRDPLRAIGADLYSVLNPDSDGGMLPANRSDFVRIRLRFGDGLGTLAGLPWEAVYSGGEHLALTGNVAITRDMSAASDTEPRRIDGAARMLVAWASPRDMALVDGINTEVEAIRDAVGANLKTFTIECAPPLEHATPTSLDEALRKGYDIVHFIGHGGFDVDEPAIYLEDRRGDAVPVVADELITWFRPEPESGRRAPAVAVLNACRTADGAGVAGSTGLAARLVEAEATIAAVGMGYPITSSAAAVFARAFYRSLTRHGQIDRAAADGRRQVSRGFGTDVRDWCTPRLYLGVRDGIPMKQRK